MLGDILWPLAAMVVGVAAVVKFGSGWSKHRAIALRIRESEVSLKLAEQNDLSEERRHQRLDEDIARGERQLALERAKLTVEADAELEAATKLQRAAEKRLKATEADAKAKYADDVAKQAAEDDKIAHRAQMQALIKAADEWAKSQPELKLPNPFEGLGLEGMYREFMEKQFLQDCEVDTFDTWLGDSPKRLAVALAKAFKA